MNREDFLHVSQCSIYGRPVEVLTAGYAKGQDGKRGGWAIVADEGNGPELLFWNDHKDYLLDFEPITFRAVNRTHEEHRPIPSDLVLGADPPEAGRIYHSGAPLGEEFRFRVVAIGDLRTMADVVSNVIVAELIGQRGILIIPAEAWCPIDDFQSSEAFCRRFMPCIR
jgi:hypothetical protein